MDRRIISSLLKIANNLDKIGLYNEANQLTKIANEESQELVIEDFENIEDFLKDFIGNIIKFTRYKHPVTGETMYRTIFRIKNKISQTEPTSEFSKGIKDFHAVTDKYPRTPYIHLPEFETHRPGKTRKSPDYEGNEMGYQGPRNPNNKYLK